MNEERIFMEYSYEMFLVEEAINRANIFNYLDAHVALESGDIAAISYVCESAIDSIKAGISKIIDAIKRLWNKFLERVGEFITSDKAYFEKYRDVINKHPFKPHELEDYYEFDIDGITSKFTTNSINIGTGFDELIKIEKEDDVKEFFMKTYLPSLNSSNTIKEEIETALKGEPKTVKMDSLNKANIFNFCANYDKTTLPNLKNEIAKMNAIENLAKDKISKALQGLEQIQKDKAADKEKLNSGEAQPKDTPDMDAKHKASIDALKADVSEEPKDKKEQSVNASYMFNGSFNYVNEMKAKSLEKSESSPSTGSNLDSTDRANVGAAVGKHIGSSSDADIEDSKNKYQAIQKNSTKFFTCCGEMLSAKMTVAMAAYKQCRQILRVHVRDYVANEAAPNANKK